MQWHLLLVLYTIQLIADNLLCDGHTVDKAWSVNSKRTVQSSQVPDYNEENKIEGAKQRLEDDDFEMSTVKRLLGLEK